MPKNIETITIKGSDDVLANVAGSNITGLETISVLKSVDAEVHANSTTDVNVSGASGNIIVNDGKNVVVEDATLNTSIVVNGAVGTITVTDTDAEGTVGADDIVIDGGTDVTVTATSDATSADIIIGATTQATGDVKVTQNVTSDATAGGVTAGAITVKGGSTIDITSNLTTTSGATGDTTVIIDDTITATGDGSTTSVTITQNSVANNFAGTAATTAATTETAVVTFGALAAGESVTIGGTGAITIDTDLTFTASKALTAAEVAAAFANLTDKDTQANGGKTANGYFEGTLVAGWTSGAASGDTVTFTATSTGNQTNLAFVTDSDSDATTVGGTAAANVFFDIDVTDGAVAVGGSAANSLTATYGNVVVDESGTAAITTITLNGYDTATLGGGGSLDKLATLNLANGQATGKTELTSTVATLNVTLNDMAGTVDLDGPTASTATTLKTLNLTTTGEASDIILDAQAVETLTIAAGADLDLNTGTDLAALKTVTITGAGNVTLGDISTALETLTASAANGNITAEVDGRLATVTTGAGHDSITVNSTTVTNAITLGNGTDTLTLTALNDLTDLAAIAGGAGTDTVVLDATNANNTATGLSFLGTSNIFKSKVTGFEKLEIVNAITAGTIVNVGNLGYNHVITNAVATHVLTLDGMANKGTVELNKTTVTANSIVVNVKDADTGATDVLNVALKTTASTENAGTLTVASVETINISTVDLDTKDKIDAATQLKLVADSAKTVTVDGDADLTLDMTGNTAVTLIDGSKMTGDLKVTAFNSGMTVKGGDGNDTLSVHGTSTISVSGVVLTGGKGTDKFDVSKFESLGNAGSAVTITDLTAGETIIFADADKFVSSKITLIAESTFTEYVAEAAKVANGDISWFQLNNNTFVVQDVDGSKAFNTGDIIVKINGLVDLSTASFNATTDTLVIA